MLEGNDRRAAHLADFTARLLEKIEKQAEAWVPGWNILGGWMPRNLATKKAYRGVNLFWLSLYDMPSPWWLTFRQAKQLGGSVRKGEHGVRILFFSPSEREEDGSRKRAVLRTYTVFNASQCDLPAEAFPAVRPVVVEENQADRVIEAWARQLRGHFIQSPACQVPSYNVRADQIMSPPRGAFKNDALYYGSILHEFVHSTGHPDRLARFKPGDESEPFGSLSYAVEEFVAELGSALFANYLGVQTEGAFASSAAYLRGWAQRIAKEPKFALEAMGKAQKAVDYLCAATGFDPFGQEAEAEAEELESV